MTMVMLYLFLMIQDRRRSKNNLLILNILEQGKNSNSKLSRNNDIDNVKYALSKIQNWDTEINFKNVKQLGFYDSVKICPTLVK